MLDCISSVLLLVAWSSVCSCPSLNSQKSLENNLCGSAGAPAGESVNQRVEPTLSQMLRGVCQRGRNETQRASRVIH